MSRHSEKYRITGYGDQLDFSSLGEAQTAIRACGGDFADVTLTVAWTTEIHDQNGNIVGEVLRTDAR